ncbi:hypothetical protein DICSQDRAFT_152534 [Dichomitus squalens LYAD-421 SS1]|uniref:uncharacterized protein n=1 Tax=Dichomitus squalens (strain LYAD-421) TaxID=732165 RepID=UPI0004414F72|nr:uncharacterized protein DICSQDRAFT_152534 [Dichomitus squalens LYAD-421 SS1]EJF65306.1 hypothetical protein DICSQDRAFT_152534 [Dichomitus squalens LYAD-421 SS1]
MPPNPTIQAIFRTKQVSAWLMSLCVRVDSYSCSLIRFCDIPRIADKQRPITCTQFSSDSDLQLTDCVMSADERCTVFHSAETNTVSVSTRRFEARYTPSDSLITPYVQRNRTKLFAPMAMEIIAHASTCP